MTTPQRLRPTFTDLVKHRTLSNRLLEARVHVASSSLPPGFRPLRDAVAAGGGDVSIGDEPGSEAYRENSPYRMLRTGSLSRGQLDPTLSRDGGVGVAPYGFVQQDLLEGDLVIAKDGPVGQVGYLGTDQLDRTMISSGIMRVRVPGQELFHFAVMKYGTYTADVELLTPRGSTYQHAGRELLLDAAVPDPAYFPSLALRLTGLASLVVGTERAAASRLTALVELIDRAVGTAGMGEPQESVRPTYATLVASKRLDARRQVARFGALGRAIESVPHISLRELERSGRISVRRAQNLQVDAIGFSEKHDDERAGAYRLIEPNMIRRDMTVPRSRWLSCATKLAVLPDDVVLMSAEGSVGNVTLYRDEQGVRTISNIHAFIIQPTDEADREETACWIAATLVWLREKGWLDSVSAGGQGGSLGKNYHDDVLLPELDAATMTAVHTLLIGERDKAPTAADLMSADMDQLTALRQQLDGAPVTMLDPLRRNAERAIRSLIADQWPDLAE